MFGPTIAEKSEHPALDEAGSACFNALRQAVEAVKFFDSASDADDVSLACWSLVHGLSALLVDGRLAEHDLGPAEAVATRLTRLLSDSLAALGDKKPSGVGSTVRKRPGCVDRRGGEPACSNRPKHPLRRERCVKPSDSFAD
jgi:hypothetical protein